MRPGFDDFLIVAGGLCILFGLWSITPWAILVAVGGLMVAVGLTRS